MALVQTETTGFLRDTTNMALVNNDTRAYEIHKRQSAQRRKQETETQELKDQVQELKDLVAQLKPTKRTDTKWL
jgi:diphthamide synthase (EF-2-diphthine--ammonia ligase)